MLDGASLQLKLLSILSLKLQAKSPFIDQCDNMTLEPAGGKANEKLTKLPRT